MKKVRLPVFVGALLLCGLPAFAQDEHSKVDLFLGYAYVHFVPALSGNPSYNFNGGGGAVTYNVNKLFGLKAEFTQVGAGNLTVNSSTGLTSLTTSGNFFTYLFGPQLTFRNSSRITPYAHLLFGGAHSNVYGNIAAAGSISTTTTITDATKEAFALAVGGGLDVRASKHVAIRLGQFDYLMTRFSGREVDTSGTGSIGALDISNQSNFRYMAGIVFLLGGSK